MYLVKFTGEKIKSTFFLCFLSPFLISEMRATHKIDTDRVNLSTTNLTVDGKWGYTAGKNALKHLINWKAFALKGIISLVTKLSVIKPINLQAF